MTTYTEEILEQHALWLESNGQSGQRADLRGANLIGACLRGVDLRGARLIGADLRGTCLIDADLREANLRGADLSRASLRGANLSGAILRGADLSSASLRGADLSGAILENANLSDADLRGATLIGADLSWADLREASLIEADLSEAYLRWAKLSGANLRGAKGICPKAMRLSVVPAGDLITPAGDLVGWKKCRNGVIVKLRIPAAAKRSNATGRKCRAEFAEVLEVIGAEEGVSIRDKKTTYRVGETVRPHEWCEDRWEESAGGIHFYLTRLEAEWHQ